MPGDTNKTPLDCSYVPKASHTVHMTCEGIKSALFFDPPQQAHGLSPFEKRSVPVLSVTPVNSVVGGRPAMTDFST